MTMTITVEGMTCEHCEKKVVDALEGVDGVTGATADREADVATIEGAGDLDAMLQAVEDAGYSASA